MKIGIVGGGPGGLFCAYQLQKLANEPLELTILEAADRFGGKILTPKFTGSSLAYEAGAAEFYDYSHLDCDPLKQLVTDELALPISEMGGSAVVSGRPAIVQFG